MFVELLCRFLREPSEEEKKRIKEEKEYYEIIGEEYVYTESKNKYEYLPMSINIKDVSSFNFYDRANTCVRFYTGGIYVFKISYEDFKNIYVALSGTIVHDFSSPGSLKIVKNER